MSWNGTGTYTRTNGTNTGSTLWAEDAAAAVKITTSRHDTHDEDIATAINACLTQNNESKPTADFAPNVTATYDIGTTSLKWVDGHYSGTLNSATVVTSGDATVGGDIIVTGTVDGRDVATDGTKLDGVEASAEANAGGNHFMATLNSSYTLTTSAATVVFDTPNYNPDSDFDNGTGIYTPSAAGVYVVSANFRYATTSTAGANLEAAIVKNASTTVAVARVLDENADSGALHPVSMMSIVSMNGSTDTLKVEASQTTIGENGQITGVGFNSNFMAYRIS